MLKCMFQEVGLVMACAYVYRVRVPTRYACVVRRVCWRKLERMFSVLHV